MGKENYIITSSCRIDRRHVEKGTIIQLDSDDKTDLDKIALLNMNGRIARADKETVEQVKREIASEKANEERMAEQNRRLSGKLVPA